MPIYRKKPSNRVICRARAGRKKFAAMADGAEYLVRGIAGDYSVIQKGEFFETANVLMRSRAKKAAETLAVRIKDIGGHELQVQSLKRIVNAARLDRGQALTVRNKPGRFVVQEVVNRPERTASDQVDIADQERDM